MLAAPVNVAAAGLVVEAAVGKATPGAVPLTKGALGATTTVEVGMETRIVVEIDNAEAVGAAVVTGLDEYTTGTVIVQGQLLMVSVVAEVTMMVLLLATMVVGDGQKVVN